MSQTLCLVCIDTGEVGINQLFGKFSGISNPGLNLVCWPFQTVTNVSTKIQQLEVETTTKTKDNVTLTVKANIQIAVNPMRAEQYVFKLSDPHRQITAHVHDTIRSTLPYLTLDEAFESKERMAAEIKAKVSASMEEYALVVHSALVTDMIADANVLRAMNEINAARRHRVAAVDQAEAEKNLRVKESEAAAEAQELSGKGTARMRQAITEGLKGSIESMRESTGMNPHEVIHMMLETQYLDVLKEFAGSGRATMVMTHNPSPHDIELQVRKGFEKAAAAAAALPAQGKMK